VLKLTQGLGRAHDQMKTKTDSTGHGQRAGGRWAQPRVRLGAVVALAIGAGLIAWAVIGNGGSSSQPATGSSSQPATNTQPAANRVGPVALSAGDLQTLARSLQGPVYWAGPKPGYRYELTQTADGKAYVRYLPAGVKAGDKRATFLIIATYPFPDALTRLKALSQQGGTNLPGGGFALPDAAYPKSVHLAFPGVNYEVEVYDFSPTRSRRVALSGQVQPVR
jgi:hypothetical protein